MTYRNGLSALTGRFTPGINAAEALAADGLALWPQPLTPAQLYSAIASSATREELVAKCAELITITNPSVVMHAETVLRTLAAAQVQGYVHAEEGTT